VCASEAPENRIGECGVASPKSPGLSLGGLQPPCSRPGFRVPLGTHFPSSFALYAAQNRKCVVLQGLTNLGSVAKRSVSFRNFPKLSVSFRSVPPVTCCPASPGRSAEAVPGRSLVPSACLLPHCLVPGAECLPSSLLPGAYQVRVACGPKRPSPCCPRAYGFGARCGTFRFFPELSETFRFVPPCSAGFRPLPAGDEGVPRDA